MEEPVIFIFKNKEKLVKGFSEHFMSLTKEKQGKFHVALSGGSTPKTWFEDLAEFHRHDIDWNSVHLYWGDERCVPPDDQDSNYGMTKTHLLDFIDIPKVNIHRIRGEEIPGNAAVEYEQELMKSINTYPLPIFDLVILGMGEDGHTASIFPYEKVLWNSDKLCVVATHPVTGQFRVSITGQVINHAKSVAFLVTGKNKAGKVKEIIYKETVSADYPASMVSPEHGSLYWFLDREAAEFITP